MKPRQPKGPASARPHLNHRATPRLYVRRAKVLIFSVGAIPTRQLSLQPVAIGAAGGGNETAEAFDGKGRLGDSASRQAVTRVNAEQASKRVMWEPTRAQTGKAAVGLQVLIRGATQAVRGPTGVMATACLHRENDATREAPGGGRVSPTGRPRGTGRAAWGGGEVRSTVEAG